MAEYEVVFRINVEADSEQAAAEYFRDNISTWAPGGIYEVWLWDGGRPGSGVQIDLSGEIEPVVLPPIQREDALEAEFDACWAAGFQKQPWHRSGGEEQ